MYGREAKLPNSFDQPEVLEETMIDRLYTLVDHLPETRESVKQQIKIV